MARYQVILAYDGTEFQGFQRQARVRTVQGVIEDALRKLGWQGASLLAAGRTDAGVHASGQVIAFDLQWQHSPLDLLMALNANLPADVAARDIHIASPEFHPRYDAVSRCYRYHIFCEPVRSPLRERYAWRVWPLADPDRMQEAASRLSGSHDFAAFGNPPQPGGKTIRTVTRAEWLAVGPLLVFEIVSEAFLYHMVRRLVSFQVEIGQGRREMAQVEQYLGHPAREMVQGLAPPQGLVLVEVLYRHNESGQTKSPGLDDGDEVR
jgi:tRNA pseudouridine38-40 synthase